MFLKDVIYIIELFSYEEAYKILNQFSKLFPNLTLQITKYEITSVLTVIIIIINNN